MYNSIGLDFLRIGPFL